jgi:hypothetical protein
VERRAGFAAFSDYRKIAILRTGWVRIFTGIRNLTPVILHFPPD